jgi:hypothetical protein
MARDDFSAPVKSALRMRAALICSNPDCRKQTAAPSESDPDSFVCLGKAAHITAAAEGGPRYDASISTEARKAISNAIYLCGSCADLIDKNGGVDFPESILRQWKEQHELWVRENLNRTPGGVGGEGGSGTIVGDRGLVIGGRGGNGGVAGVGGKGGSGFINGNDGVIIGGDGGNCATTDGRGGKPAKGPTERFGISSFMWGFGRGGAGANHPEYDRRVRLLSAICQEYKTKLPEDSFYIDAGIERVPSDWVNQRLLESGESWRVLDGETGFLLPLLQPQSGAA